MNNGGVRRIRSDSDRFFPALSRRHYPMVVTDTNIQPYLLSGFQSLVGMGVATVRLVAAVLTVLGVWIHLDTLSYLSTHQPIQPQPKPLLSQLNLNASEKSQKNLSKYVTVVNYRSNSDDESVLSTALDADFSPPANPPANGQSFYQTDPERFIIPLLSMGPNNQLEGFLESVFLAIKLNRTLCIPPFFKHKTDELNQSVSAELRIDKNVLSKFITICTEEELPLKCPQVSAIWMGSSNIVCGLALQKRYNVFIEQTGIEPWYSASRCQPLSGIPSFPKKTEGKFQVRSTAKTDLQATFSDATSGRCVVWFFPFHTISNFRSAVMSHLLHKNDGGDRQLAMDVVKYVQRPEKIRNLVAKFLRDHANNKPIIAVHWRYDQQDWLLHCDRLPDGQADKSCRNVAQMLDNPELAADNFRIFLRGVRNSLKTELAIYIAAPLDEKIMSSKLIAAISELGETALYSKDLLPYLSAAGYHAGEIHDVLSTSEQELCYQSHVFLYSQISTWSFNLVYQRRVDGRSSIDNFYVFGGQAVAAATHQAVEYFKRI